jgi:hypothetical protein
MEFLAPGLAGEVCASKVYHQALQNARRVLAARATTIKPVITIKEIV